MKTETITVVTAREITKRWIRVAEQDEGLRAAAIMQCQFAKDDCTQAKYDLVIMTFAQRDIYEKLNISERICRYPWRFKSTTRRSSRVIAIDKFFAVLTILIDRAF